MSATAQFKEDEMLAMKTKAIRRAFAAVSATVMALVASIGISTATQASIPVLTDSLVILPAGNVGAMALKWKVGDKASYKMSGGFINGTAEMYVREDNGTEIWVQQDMNLGFLGQQKVEILYDKATGQVKKILANGQEQQLPNQNDIELLETKEDRVTVPAGTFDAIYAKVKDKKNNQIQEAWLNPKEVPINGLLKTISDSQMGKISLELTAKHFAP